MNNRLTYSFDREITTISQLPHSPIVIGGRNLLRLLTLSPDQTHVTSETSLFEPTSRLSNINTIKCTHNTVACGLANGNITLHHVGGKSRLIQRMTEHKRSINSLDFVDPNQLLSGSQDGTIKLWDVRTGRCVITTSTGAHSDPIRSCQFSPHGKVHNRVVVLSAHDSGALYKHDLRSNHVEKKWNMHTGPALSLHIHPDKEYVLTGGRDQKMCVLDYSGNSRQPEYTVNTYGPVMKVRWSPYGDDDVRSLFKYDFACSYLNDDATLSVHNLSRKYIPRQIIRSFSNRPFQNFIWSNTPRKVFAITKTNSFSVYDLDHDVTRPLDDLSVHSIDWRNGEVCFVSQDTEDFEGSEDSECESVFEEEYPVPTASIMQHYSKSATVSPQEKPPMLRSFTQSSFGKSPSPRPERLGFERERERLDRLDRFEKDRFEKQLEKDRLEKPDRDRPPLFRHGSTTTYDSLQKNDYSPYIVPLTLPVPLDDDTVFTTLASNYVVHVPDGMTLREVCLVNASVSASVKRFRDCQVWRVIAVALEEDQPVVQAPGEVEEEEEREGEGEGEDKSVSDVPIVGSYNSNSTSATFDDKKSVNLMDLINQRGSFGQSNQLYRRSGKREKDKKEKEKGTEENKDSKKEIGDEDYEILKKNEVVKNMEDEKNINGDQKDIETSSDNKENKELPEDIGKDTEKPNSIENKKDKKGVQEIHTQQTEHKPVSPSKRHNKEKQAPKEEGSRGIMDIENRLKEIEGLSGEEILAGTINESTVNKKTKSSAPPKGPQKSGESFAKALANLGSDHTMTFSYDNENAIVDEDDVTSHPVPKHRHSWGKEKTQNQNLVKPRSSQSFSYSRVRMDDLDDENSPRSRYSSVESRYHLTSPGISRRNSRLRNSPQWRKEPFSEQLSECSEIPVDIDGKSRSVLSKVLKEKKENLVPWQVQSILDETLTFASRQGDIVMCATLTLLFYHLTGERKRALDWLSLYVEILHRKRLFVSAANVINMAPKDIQKELKDSVVKDVDLRFYCCWCGKLLVNERSKGSPNFGFWYCDECGRNQSNCVYCHEPCRGLTVVASLDCGHIGHFGCLREWYVNGENVECPGGCDYTVEKLEKK